MSEKKAYRFIKRIFDIVFSIIALSVILVLILPIVVVIIRIESKGNPFFIQKRVGKNGKMFHCYKFRTMKLNSTPEKQADYNDSRVTNFGRILRYSGLDELPQFVNILFGQMSVVGPRPHMVSHDKEFNALISGYNERHKIKPGITGLAQIRGCRGQIEHVSDLKIRLKHDVSYIDRMNIGLDIYIIYRSMIDMFKGAKNAY